MNILFSAQNEDVALLSIKNESKEKKSSFIVLKMDEENEIESPTKTVEKRSKKESKKVKRKKTNGDGSTKSRKKSVKKESTKNIAASSEEDLEDIYRSEANLIPG